jgi:hypothetical protein
VPPRHHKQQPAPTNRDQLLSPSAEALPPRGHPECLRTDDQIDREIATAAANGQEVDWSELKQAAIDATKQALQEVQAVRDTYAGQLDASRLEMAARATPLTRQLPSTAKAK